MRASLCSGVWTATFASGGMAGIPFAWVVVTAPMFFTFSFCLTAVSGTACTFSVSAMFVVADGATGWRLIITGRLKLCWVSIGTATTGLEASRVGAIRLTTGTAYGSTIGLAVSRHDGSGFSTVAGVMTLVN